jgi:hypothetical protein
MTAAVLILLNACNYLDVVPDHMGTIEYMFRNRNEAERYLFTCYSYRPAIGDIDNDPAMAGDEVWQSYPLTGTESMNHIFNGQQIARGFQTRNDPWLNFWDGRQGAKCLWRGIRDCNIFLENIDLVPDITPYEKVRWVAEAKFLKAYYHYYLLKCYGPIPVTDVNLPISSGVDEVKVYREPVDRVVEYISGLMLEAAQDLPDVNQVMEGTQAGRIDRLGALSIHAELLLTHASDLFNGNQSYAGEVNKLGEQLFNQTYDPNRWKIAADACKELIELCHAQNKELYDLTDPVTLIAPKPLQLQTTYRQAICDSWNSELIWGSTNNDCDALSRAAHARIVHLVNVGNVTSMWAPTLKLAESYYSSNGVPISEDREWMQNGWYNRRYEVREAPSSGVPEVYYVKEGERTAYLHYNREPRFYASIGFDRGIYYGSGYYDFNSNVKHCLWFFGEYGGFTHATGSSVTGYCAKKMHSFHCTLQEQGFSLEYYPFPIMRLANVYLMYAEALNEFYGPNEPEIFTYLDMIRARAGLEGVRESWTKYSTNPTKPYSKEGLREIIRQERGIELAMEGKRFWDLRRWKKIEELNIQPQGWNAFGTTREDFYVVTDIARTRLSFTTRDYFWPLSEDAVINNPNLNQNYGW